MNCGPRENRRREELHASRVASPPFSQHEGKDRRYAVRPGQNRKANEFCIVYVFHRFGFFAGWFYQVLFNSADVPSATINEQLMAIGPKSYSGLHPMLGIFFAAESEQELCATRNGPRKWLTIKSPHKNHVYSIVKNIQVPIPLFRRYV